MCWKAEPATLDAEARVPFWITRRATNKLSGVNRWSESHFLGYARVKVVIEGPITTMKAPRDAKHIVVHMAHVTMGYGTARRQ